MAAQLGTGIQASLTFSSPLLFVLAGVVALWAIFFPATVRDADERKLPPNVTARILVVFIYLLTYVALVAAFAFGGEAVTSLGTGTQFQDLIQSLKGNAPLLGITVLAGLHSLSYFRELESALIVWLHSARHLSNDVQTLAVHLHDCSYRPSQGEREKNFDYLRDFDIYVTDSGTKMLQLEAVNAWRKTSTLLRLLRVWNSANNSALTDAELKTVEDLEKAHGRKTRLAMDIIRMLEHLDRGGAAEAELAGIAALLADTSHKDRAVVSDVEARLKSLAERTQGVLSRPVRLTSDQLQQYLVQIESYFRVEYALLLQQVAQLAAKSVVLAGDEAPQRLEQMKSVGFGQLGRIVPVNFDRILWVFFAVSLGGFLILLFFPRPTARFGMPADLAARIAIVMALAALVGSVVGSNRKLAARPQTPWSSFLIAGLISASMFLVVHGAAFVLKQVGSDGLAAAETRAAEGSQSDRSLAESRPASDEEAGKTGAAAKGTGEPGEARRPRGPTRFSDLIPWAVTPFFLTLAICWLARLPAWPRLGGAPAGVADRVLDGLAVTAVMLLAQSTAYALHLALDTSFAVFLQKRIAEASVAAFLLRPNPSLALAFFIGTVVVRDVRLAAHAQLTDPRALSEFLATSDAPSQVQASPPRPADAAAEHVQSAARSAIGPATAMPRSG
jgi:hypothetical protein